MGKIRLYFQDYVKWFPEEWEWGLADEKSRELYMKFRARKGSLHRDNDKMPCFDSIEKDANQFGLTHVEFTDFFGIGWEGSKGRHRYVGDADYEQHMYYWDEEDDCEEGAPSVSDDVTASKVPDGYAEVSHRGVKHYVCMDEVMDAKYHYIVENHLFKDSHVTLSYRNPLKDIDDWEDSDVLRVWDIHGIAAGLKKFKPELYRKFLSRVDEHFKKLQESNRDEERAFAPTDKDGKFQTAEEYFEEYYKTVEERDSCRG